MKNTFILFAILLVSISSVIYGSIGDWTTYTNKGDIRDIGIVDNIIWCATNGGVLKFNIVNSSYEGFTNTEGLASITVTTLEIDRFGNIWFGTREGYINVFWKDTQSWETIDDIIEDKNHYVYDLKSSGDSLFVALDIGISLYHNIYNQSDREVKETYKNLGRGFQVEIPVKCIYLNGRDIWAGTDYGLAKSNLNISNLKAPESWINYTTSNSNLISNTIQAITSLRGDIFVATKKGISKFDGSSWITINDGLGSVDVRVLEEKNGALYAGASDGVYKLDGNRWLLVGEAFFDVTSLIVMDNGDLWVGREKTGRSEGFSHYNKVNANWSHFIPPGPGGNNIKALTVDHNGVLWCGSRSNGILRFDGHEWKRLDIKKLGYKDDGFWGVTVDRFNNKWFANWGAGAVKIDEDDNITVYNKGIFSGIDIDPNYFPVTNVTIDGNDNIWFCTYGAADGNVVVATSPDGRWQHFSTSDGIITDINNSLYAITTDLDNRIWIGSISGVSVIDYKNTLFNKSDDEFAGTLTTSDGLISNNIRSIAVDVYGKVWIGTEKGFQYWQGDVFDKSGTITDNIQVIAVDVRNNKWFGTDGGVSVLSDDDYTWTHYTIDNSFLVYSNVTSFAFDESTGKVYIGTTNGISCLETPYVKPQINLDYVSAGPNPFILQTKNEKFVLNKLADNVSIKFLTTNGILVRHVQKDYVQGFYEWDGKDDNGEYVPSGIYLFIIYNEERGFSKTGKVAVIR